MSQEEDDHNQGGAGGGGNTATMAPPSGPPAVGHHHREAPPRTINTAVNNRTTRQLTADQAEKRVRQRNNKRNNKQQNWKPPLHYNRHKNSQSNNANNTSKNNNKDSESSNNQKTSNLRGRNAFFVNTTFTMGRKRTMTFPAISKFFLPYKRPRKEGIIPPTKFLLGGNISDPLNLNSLHDDDKVTDDTKNNVTDIVDTVEDCQKEKEEKKTEETTDENSTHNSQPQVAGNIPRLRVQVIVPPNMFDPLNLLHPLEDRAEYEKQLTSPVKKKSRNRNNRKRKASKASAVNNSSGSNPDNSASSINESGDVVKNLFENEEVVGEKKEEDKVVPAQDDETNVVVNTAVGTVNAGTEGARDLKLDLSGISTKSGSGSKEAGGSQRKIRRMDSMDKIVSPVIPQPGAWMRPHRADRGGQRGNWRGRGRGRGSNNSSSNSINTSMDISVDTPDTSLTPEVSQNNEPPTIIQPPASVTATATESVTTEVVENEAESKKVEESIQEVKKDQTEEEKLRIPKFKKDGRKYQYGNYDRYYGYRNLNETMDVRLKVFQMHEHLFKGRDVLDIGCNVGHVALCVARDLGARSVTGIDIDGKLIERAKKNLRQHVAIHQKDNTPTCTVTSSDNSVDNTSDVKITVTDTNKDCDKPNPIKKCVKIAKQNNKKKKDAGVAANSTESYFPVSFPILFGPVDVLDNKQEQNTARFPHNVVFKHANYVLKDESLISAEPAQFDLIMCLSVSKWLHLNFGDAGLKRAFKRMFAQLRPGGKLILEAQNWASYKKKKSLTETIYNNYRSIEFFPCKFRDYLLSPEVGFSQCSVLGVPQHLSKGFRRPVQLFIKGDFTPSQAMWSDTRMPSASHYVPANTPSAKRPVYTAPVPAIESGAMFSYWGSTPYSMASHHTNNIFDMSPFYAPGSGSYTPSYSEGHRNVYAPVDSRWSPATTGTPSQSPAQQRDTPTVTPNATPNVTPSATPGWTNENVPNRNLSRVYATISSGSDSAAGTPFHHSQSSPRYSPNWNTNNGDYYNGTISPGQNVYSPQEDTASSTDEQSRDHQPATNESSSTPTASAENSPSVHSASFRSGDSPHQDDETIVNGHNGCVTSPSAGDCESANVSPVSNC